MLPAIIQKLVPRFASEFENEVIATRNAIGQALRSTGLDWNDVLIVRKASRASTPEYPAPMPNFFDMAHACRDHYGGYLNDWEWGFVTDMCRRASSTPKQMERLSSIFARVSRRAAA